jgi:site-specific DNA-cytosine methylase
MKFISMCSGIEAASVAFEPLGWEALAFSEIELDAFSKIRGDAWDSSP